jgi:hypothetical protein
MPGQSGAGHSVQEAPDHRSRDAPLAFASGGRRRSEVAPLLNEPPVQTTCRIPIRLYCPGSGPAELARVEGMDSVHLHVPDPARQ